MASETPVADHVPDKHIEEKEVSVAKHIEDKATPQVAAVKEECHYNGGSVPVVEEKKDDESIKDSGKEETTPKEECHQKEPAPFAEEKKDETMKDQGQEAVTAVEEVVTKDFCQETTPVVEEKRDEPMMGPDEGTPIIKHGEVLKDSVQDTSAIMGVVEKRDEALKGSDEGSPTNKQDGILKDFVQETLVISSVMEERTDVSNPVSEPAKRSSDEATSEATDPLNAENGIKVPGSVESLTENGKNLKNFREIEMEKKENETIVHATETTIKVEDLTDRQSISSIEMEFKVAEIPINNNTGSLNVGEGKEAEKSSEVTESIVVEVEKSNDEKPVAIPIAMEHQVLEEKVAEEEKLAGEESIKTPTGDENLSRDKVVETPVEKNPEVPKSAAESTIETENLIGKAAETDVVPLKDETTMNVVVAVESKSDVKADDDVSKVDSSEDETPQRETTMMMFPMSSLQLDSEDNCCTTRGEVSQMTENFESSSTEMADRMTKIEGLENGKNGVDHIPTVARSTEDIGKKEEKDGLPFDSNEAMAPENLLMKDATDPSATVLTVIAAVNATPGEVADVLEVDEVSRKPEVCTVSDADELVVKEANKDDRGSGDAASKEVKTPTNEAAKTEAPEEEVAILTEVDEVSRKPEVYTASDAAVPVVKEVNEDVQGSGAAASKEVKVPTNEAAKTEAPEEEVAIPTEVNEVSRKPEVYTASDAAVSVVKEVNEDVRGSGAAASKEVKAPTNEAAVSVVKEVNEDVRGSGAAASKEVKAPTNEAAKTEAPEVEVATLTEVNEVSRKPEVYTASDAAESVVKEANEDVQDSGDVASKQVKTHSHEAAKTEAAKEEVVTLTEVNEVSRKPEVCTASDAAESVIKEVNEDVRGSEDAASNEVKTPTNEAAKTETPEVATLTKVNEVSRNPEVYPASDAAESVVKEANEDVRDSGDATSKEVKTPSHEAAKTEAPEVEVATLTEVDEVSRNPEVYPASDAAESVIKEANEDVQGSGDLASNEVKTPSHEAGKTEAAEEEVATLTEVNEVSRNPEVCTASDAAESAIKEVNEDVRGSGDAASKEVKTPSNEATKTETPEEEVATQISSFVVDEKTAKDANLVETVVKQVTEGVIIADVAEKLVEGKAESMEAREGNGVEDTSKTDDLKTDGKKDGTKDIESGSLVEAPKDVTETAKQQVQTKMRSPNVMSKVKHSLVKAKKAIFGKSPSSKTISTEAKVESKE